MDKENIRLNEWISKPSYSYEFFWPYCDKLDVDNEIIDYYVKYNSVNRVGSFVTPGFISKFLDKGDAYSSFDSSTVFIRKISHDLAEKAIEQMINKGNLEHFTLIAEISTDSR